jgi:hypothetical protein
MTAPQRFVPQQLANGGEAGASALAEQLSWLQRQLAAQAHEQHRQLAYVQAMHGWAGQIAASLRALQRQGRAAAAAAGAAQEESAAAKATLVQLAGLQDSSMQQVGGTAVLLLW